MALAVTSQLQSPGWFDPTRRALESLIRAGAGKGLPAVFDFDNTLICGDIGEATLAVLVRSGKLNPERVSETLCPRFRVAGRGEIRLESCVDLTAYYEALLAAAAQGQNGLAPLASGYAWAVEIMEGLGPQAIVQATRAAYGLAVPGSICTTEVTPGKTGYPAPYFYPEMVELLRVLLEHEFDVWIVSASNVWSVRWMVLEALNPLLRQDGLREGLRPDHVVGISTLLADRRGRLHQDAVLVREHAGYATLHPKALAGFRLTSRLQFPVPSYSGKIACLFEAIGRNPYFCAGDAPGDHPMMAISEHRLWIARLEKPGYQAAADNLIRQTGAAGWMVQATLTTQAPGFLPSLSGLAERCAPVSAEVRQSLRILSPWLRPPGLKRAPRSHRLNPVFSLEPRQP